MAATQKWNDRPNKHKNDEELFDIIRQVIPPTGTHNVLCLPGYTFRWEEVLASQNTLRDWQFYGLQPDRAGREKLTEHAYDLNHFYAQKGIATRFHPHALTKSNKLRLEEYVCNTDRTYSIIYADWMGGWYGVTQRTIDTIFRRKLIQDGGLLIFTIQIKCARSEPKTNGFAGLVAYHNTNKDISTDSKLDVVKDVNIRAGARSIDTIVKMSGGAQGYALTLAHVGHYKGDRKAHDMFTFSYVCNRKKK